MVNKTEFRALAKQHDFTQITPGAYLAFKDFEEADAKHWLSIIRHYNPKGVRLTERHIDGVIKAQRITAVKAASSKSTEQRIEQAVHVPPQKSLAKASPQELEARIAKPPRVAPKVSKASQPHPREPTLRAERSAAGRKRSKRLDNGGEMHDD
jgi:hypothetical protein